MHLYILLGPFLLPYNNLYVIHSTFFISGFGAGNIMMDPYVHIWAMPFNFNLSSNHLFYRNIQCSLWKYHLT